MTRRELAARVEALEARLEDFERARRATAGDVRFIFQTMKMVADELGVPSAEESPPRHLSVVRDGAS